MYEVYWEHECIVKNVGGGDGVSFTLLFATATGVTVVEDGFSGRGG